MSDTPTLTMVYQNWQGKIGDRTVQPTGIAYGSTEWHPEPQWFLEAFDVDKQALRQFALNDVIRFGPPESSGMGKLVERLARYENTLRDIYQRAQNYQIEYPLEGLQPLHGLVAEVMQQADWALSHEPPLS